jgi:solute carrier family 8 (sodium/calcium exchanger)
VADEVQTVLYWLMGVHVGVDAGNAANPCAARRRTNTETGQEEHVLIKAWNPTVANLTLMALGSSAPEILLSVIEILTRDFYSGELGPSTIVGSAAFNMMVILAVCVSALPPGETRKIDDLPVFAITAVCSVFAYLWLLVILQVSSPDVVTWYEGVISFLFFPALVATAYLADQGAFSSRPAEADRAFITEVGGKTQGKNRLAGGKVFDGLLLSNLETVGKDPKEVAQMVFDATSDTTRATYRKQGVQAITGSTKHSAEQIQSRQQSVAAANSSSSQLGFECTRYRTKESVHALQVAVVRIGDSSKKVTVNYTTREDMSAETSRRATEDRDYVQASGTLNFKKGETRKTFDVQMIDDDEVEEDETFLIELSNLSDDLTELVEERKICTVTIISDDYPGVMVLAKVPDADGGYRAGYITAAGDGKPLACLVRREKGSSGEVKIKWKTVAGTAKPGVGYGEQGSAREVSGELRFQSGVSEMYINLPILAQPEAPESSSFSVELFDPQGGCVIGDAATTVRGASGTTTVEIKNDKEAQQLAMEVSQLLEEHYDDFRSGTGTYGQQFTDAVTPDDGMGGFGLVLFWFNAPWRLLFALVPPPQMMGGWLCFVCALAMIAFVTALIGDLAALLGCSIGLYDSVTAITFVALGTSLPDTFASKAAAIGDTSADAAIGNVTGSNSVNVFLGLGMPWAIAAIYWTNEGPTDEWKGTIGIKNPEIVAAYSEGGFAVPAGDLGFTVAVFCACALMVLATLTFRRAVFGAELGASDPNAKHPLITSIFFVGLWLLYVSMSILAVYKWATVDSLLKIIVGCVVLFVIVLGGMWSSMAGSQSASSGAHSSRDAEETLNPTAEAVTEV